MDAFISGFAYGLTSVIVGQPLDTIKTRLQAAGGLSTISTASQIFKQEGIKGLYRGGLPMVLGGAAIRSTQFGVNSSVLTYLRKQYGTLKPEERLWKVFDYHVILAGLCGGIGRGVVEAPFEYVKIRRQCNQPWKFTEIFKGSQATILRDSLLFCSFMIYIDLSKVIVPGGLGSFWTGAICSNLAWLTIWPMDVVKSQIQSGNYNGISYLHLLQDVIKKRLFFQGLLPGLSRSFIANGLSMIAYDKTHLWLQSIKKQN